MPRIFVSYRRSDSRERTMRITDWLNLQYGKDNVFVDVNSIEGATHFAEVITQSIDMADVIIVVIGETWTDEIINRLDADEDFVRFEVSKSLRDDKTIIPVLLEHSVANTIDADKLPTDIRDITKLNYMYARFTDFHDDMEKIKERITTLTGKSPSTQSNRNMMLFGIAFVVFSIIAAILGVTLFSNATPLPTPTPTPLPTSTPLPDFAIAVGESQIPEVFIPSEQQISDAQRRLGDDGIIAIMACTSSTEYHATLTREMVTRARELGLNVRVYDGDGDGYNQRLQLEETFLSNVQGYVLCPLDYTLIEETLASIADLNVPIVSTGGGSDSFVGVHTSNEASDSQMGNLVGEVAGEYIRDELNGEANVIVLDFPDLDTIVERADGLEAGVLANAPDATIIGRYKGGTEDFAIESMQEFLAEGTPVDVIVSINDAGAYGAIEALIEAGFTPNDVAIFSIDAEAQAVAHISNGYFIRGTLTIGRTETAVGVMNAMAQLLAGSTVPETIAIPLGDVVTADNLPE